MMSQRPTSAGSAIPGCAILRPIDARLVFSYAYRVQGMEASMRYFRRLPSLLRALLLVGLLAALVGLGVIISGLLLWLPNVVSDTQVLFGFAPYPSPAAQQATQPLGPATFLIWSVGVGINLSLLSGACNWPVQTYAIRFRRSWYVKPWLIAQLEMWQAQLLAMLALGALPLASLITLLLAPSNDILIVVVMAMTVIAACALVVANIWTLALSNA